MAHQGVYGELNALQALTFKSLKRVKSRNPFGLEEEALKD
jgi:hypothetical protein